MLFMPRRDTGALERARMIVESEMVRAGVFIYGWRAVPVDTSVLGAHAREVRPQIEQILFRDHDGYRAPGDLERVLYIARRRMEKRAEREGLADFYACSLSTRDVVYKGMFRCERISAFYPDLRDGKMAADFAIFHQRYSTNTFPQWRLAQPFRMLAHNGEINTLKANINWMKSHEIRMASEAFGEECEDVKPVIQRGSSDSAALDQVFELLVRSGRSAPMAKALLIPEAWSKRAGLLPQSTRALYAYCNAVMEPWDGPAALVACDGRWLIGGLDRNGLRPLRYALTNDGLLLAGSEAGMFGVEDDRIAERGAVGPGRMIAVDLSEGRFYREQEVDQKLADAHPYAEWLRSVRKLDDEIGGGGETRSFGEDELLRRQTAAAMTREDVEKILRPMAESGKEAVGSMGDDSPLAVLSAEDRPLAHFFRQNFSQVTNPPIDYLREDRVMSLKTRFKNLGNILAEDETQADVFTLESPFLTNGMYDRLRSVLGSAAAEIDCTFEAVSAGEVASGLRLKQALDRICAEAADVVRAGAEHVFLTDERQGPGAPAIPMALAVSAVHTCLTHEGLRTFCSLNARAGDVMDPHTAALVIGAGATTVNPYLALETLAERHAAGVFEADSLEEATQNYKGALEGGMLKIMSKMGISVVSSYRGGLMFEAVGLSRALVDEFFPGVPSRISGVGLKSLERKQMRRNELAWIEQPKSLPAGGFYSVRAHGERHALDAKIVATLQQAARLNDAKAFEEYEALNAERPPVALRDLIQTRPLGEPVPLDEVEPASDIVKRFITPGMSLGALSPEAHGALNIAMNRLGARSVSGEGGEDPARYRKLPNGDDPNSHVKQIASGRFGVTAEYLNKCEEIEIKVAQGAKPGEGGQLPGFKVNAYIAGLRHAVPGQTLISPPPHHDIYSIEDLAQLIYDLKQINPEARVTVKLVSSAGVGTVAAGVAKAKADAILIAGNVGGTGASPQTSIKFAGAPWELGLAEAHQTLTLNNLRTSVRLRTDGGLRTGRDIIVAAMLGAEEYGIGTLSLVAMGCLMVRQCHSNTCPVGVCTQDEQLRQHFTGEPEHVVNFMLMMAESVRKNLAALGARRLTEVIGRADLLAQVSRGAHHLDDLDLNLLLYPTAGVDSSTLPPVRRSVPDTLDEEVMDQTSGLFETGAPVSIRAQINTMHRTVGARLSSRIVRRFGPVGLEDGALTLELTGSAGQSLGAFGAKGLKISLTGEANDYVGKGLSGAQISVRPAHYDASAAPALVGNACLYGATSGVLFVAGRAGGRFGVRNSGATAVVEGCGAHGCEYMTGGQMVLLGSVGDNFAAGMTGGRAFVYDPGARLSAVINPDTVKSVVPDEAALAACRALIEAHAVETGSRLARGILKSWDVEAEHFVLVCPLGTKTEAAPTDSPPPAAIPAQRQESGEDLR
jgi:glutamate synthase (NADPH/NADH) large chain